MEQVILQEDGICQAVSEWVRKHWADRDPHQVEIFRSRETGKFFAVVTVVREAATA